jgi:hypothetical protein
VVKLARCLLAFVLAENTKAVYASAVTSIKRFCELHGMQLSFPISPETVALWMAHSSTKLVYSTIRVYLHGIASAHVELGAASPLDSKLVWRMFKAIKRLQGARAGKQKLPITTELLHDLEGKQQLGTLAGLSKRAAMWLGTCGLLRSGEFATRPRGTTTLLRKHLVFLDARMQPLADPASWSSAACMRVHLATSKTDPFRQGVDVLVSNGHAIAAMVQYLHARGLVDDDQPLLVGDDCRKALSVNELVQHTRATLLAAGIADADKYAGHSFRRGGATSLHFAGAPDSLIRIMGRWRSFAFARYVDVPHDRIIAAGRSMTHALPTRERVRFAVADDCKSLQYLWD